MLASPRTTLFLCKNKSKRSGKRAHLPARLALCFCQIHARQTVCRLDPFPYEEAVSRSRLHTKYMASNPNLDTTFSVQASSTAEAEAQILQALSSAKGRGKDGIDGQQLQALQEAVQQLEQDGGVEGPVAREDLLDGRCIP